MAELIAGVSLTAAKQPIPASTQILAVAWLRWRIFVNSTFRSRPKTGRQAVSMAFGIILRLIVWPFIALMAVGPILGSGIFAWMAVADHQPQRLQTLLAGMALLWQFVAINGLSIAATVSNFDPSSLIRFPLRFGRYLVLRTLIGFMTPSTIVGCLASLAAAIGIGIAKPSLALPALIVLAVYAWMNIFLTRMIGAWLERWLANRRFREIFGVLMAVFAISFQFLNFQRFSGRNHPVTHSWILTLLQGSGSNLHWLPPGLAANAILGSPHPNTSLAPFTGLVATTVLFAVVFSIRLRAQFHGEYLSEGAAPRSTPSPRSRPKTQLLQPAPAATLAPAQPVRAVFTPIIAVCLRKEWLTLTSSTQLIGLVTPLIFIVILNRGVFALHPTLFLPGAIAYVMLGILAGLYNVFGADGLGVQIYLLAPVRMRDVLVAKNLASLVLVVVEVALAWTLVLLLKRTPISLAIGISTALWTIFVIMANVTLGTLRSIQAPRKFSPGQVRQQRGTPTNRTSGLLILLVLFGSLLLQIPVVLLGRYLHQPWLAAWIFGPLATAAIVAYAVLLRNADRLILAHRDVFAEELCKA
jgi:ABC-2 type transport system permease protein